MSRAEQVEARAVALSVTHPADDPRLVDELKVLQQMLPDHVTLLVGGQAAHSYRKVLDSVGALRIAGLAELREALQRLAPQAGGRRDRG